MERVRIEDGRVSVFLNRDFYSERSIESAISAFSGIAEIMREGDRIIISPKDQDDLKLIGYEFSNFVLAGMMV